MNNSTEAGLENTTSLEWTGDVTVSVENQAATLLWQIWPAFLLLLGTFGNIATISVMRRIKDSNSSQHVILMSLAMSDLCLLYVGVLRQWVFNLFHVDIYELHAVVCKVCCWLIYGASTTSSWLLTCVTVQRTMAVKWPHRMRVVCTLQRTRIAIVAVALIGCSLHSHFLYGMVISEDNKCIFMSPAYEEFVNRIWAWVDLGVFSLFPSVFLLVCNVILSFTLLKATSSTAMTMHSSASASSSDVNVTRKKAASRTTIMILALSCTFLILTMPVCVYLIWDYYTFDPTDDTTLWTRDAALFAVTLLLWYTNSSVNFLLYCFTGTKFRTEFLNWISCGTKS
ncbi:neuromedin U receptor homolog nmur-2-like [Babylonia areolata]|uniref:neuromedin U receptor homolog nmur-2-like n=1 Tax=Babylonia areolata TaxID=304850 RepID=UPI003FD2FAC6